MKLNHFLELERCPHCNVNKPSLAMIGADFSTYSNAKYRRFWRTYYCGMCGMVVTAFSSDENGFVDSYFPKSVSLGEYLPPNAKAYLSAALNCKHEPIACVISAASAVDAMLKSRGLTEGSLYIRIDQAVEQNLITEDMSKWAHHVRLEANAQRHADENDPLPTSTDADRCLEFAITLGRILYELPELVSHGLKAK